MAKKWQPVLFSLIISCILMLICNFAFSFFYVDYQGIHDQLTSGKLTPGMPFRSLYFIYNIGISYLYYYLFRIFPNIDWFALAFGIILILSCSLVVLNTFKIYHFKHIISFPTLLIICFCFIVFAENNFKILVTRVAYTLAGSAILSIIISYPNLTAIKKKWGVFLFYNLLFIFATLTRTEASLAVLSLSFFWSLFYLQDIKQTILLYLFPSSFILFILIGISIYINNTKGFYVEIEPEIEVEYIEKQNIIPISEMHTIQDSAKYKMAANIFWSDPAVLSPKFLRSLIKPRKQNNWISTELNRVLKDISQACDHEKILLLILLFCACLLFYLTQKTKSFRQLCLFFIFEISFWILIVLQTFVFKINERSFAPLVQMFILFHFFLLIKYGLFALKKTTQSFIAFGLIILSAFYFQVLKKYSSELAKRNVALNQEFEEIRRITKGGVVAINSSVFEHLFMNRKPFSRFNLDGFKRIYITDAHAIPFMPWYKEYMEKECNCNIYDYPSFWNFLIRNNQTVYIVSKPLKFAVVKNYLSVMYHLSLPIEQIESDKLKETAVYLVTKEKSINQQK